MEHMRQFFICYEIINYSIKIDNILHILYIYSHNLILSTLVIFVYIINLEN
jgi:hypothetical protein